MWHCVYVAIGTCSLLLLVYIVACVKCAWEGMPGFNGPCGDYVTESQDFFVQLFVDPLWRLNLGSGGLRSFVACEKPLRDLFQKGCYTH